MHYITVFSILHFPKETLNEQTNIILHFNRTRMLIVSTIGLVRQTYFKLHIFFLKNILTYVEIAIATRCYSSTYPNDTLANYVS